MCMQLVCVLVCFVFGWGERLERGVAVWTLSLMYRCRKNLVWILERRRFEHRSRRKTGHLREGRGAFFCWRRCSIDCRRHVTMSNITVLFVYFHHVCMCFVHFSAGGSVPLIVEGTLPLSNITALYLWRSD